MQAGVLSPSAGKRPELKQGDGLNPPGNDDVASVHLVGDTRSPDGQFPARAAKLKSKMPFVTLAVHQTRACFVLPDSHNVVHRKRIIALAAEYRLPTIYYFRFLHPTVDSSLMVPMKWISSCARLAMLTEFSKAPVRPIYPSSSRQSSNW